MVQFLTENADIGWERRMIVGLDIGTSCIRVVVGGEDDSGNFRILGTSCEKSAGLRNGNIVNIEAAANAIRNAIENAEQNGGVDVHSCYTSIGGDQIEGLNTRGKVAVSSKGKSQSEIGVSDLVRVRESATAVKLALDRDILHVVTQDYIVDGIGDCKEPLHRLGVCLEVAVHIVTASRTTIQNLKNCINRANYELDGVVLKTLGATMAVATKDELDLGSIVIDLGAGTTDILVLDKGAPVCTASIPVGGNMVTNDIAYMLNVNQVEAERIKLEAGCCWVENVDPNRTIIINGVGGQPPREIYQSQLFEYIAPRVEEIFEMVLNKILEKTNLTQLGGNIILTGGGANLPGIVQLVQNVFQTQAVRIGMPEKLGGIEEDYAGPEWATAVGIVIYSREDEAAHADKSKKRISSGKKRKADGDGKNPFAKFAKAFRSLF